MMLGVTSVAVLRRTFTTSTWTEMGVKVTAAMVKELRAATGAPMMECKTALSEPEVEGDMDKATDWLRKKGVVAAQKKAGRSAAQGLVGVAVGHSRAVVVEINSETDFVARNDVFQSAVREIADNLLASFPVDVPSSSTSSEGLSTVIYEGDEALTPILDAGVRDAVVDIVAQVRENVQFRRVAVVTAPDGGMVLPYVHNMTAPGMGTIASVISVKVQPGVSADSTETAALTTALKPVVMHVAAANPRYLERSMVPEEDLERERQILSDGALQSGKPPEIVAKMVEGRMRKFYEEYVLVDQDCMLADGKVGEIVGASAGADGVSQDSVELTGFVRFKVGEGLE